jgi:chromosomal replication initiator protein
MKHQFTTRSFDLPRCPRMREIQERVCEHYGVTRLDLVSQRRHRAILEPRAVAMYLCRSLTMFSLPAIGMAFDRHHSVVLDVVRKVERMVVTDDSVARAVGELRQDLIAEQERLAA